MRKSEKAEPAIATEVPPLDDYIASQERRAIDPVVLVQISHPDAHPGLRHGARGGFRLVNGPLGASFSDGSTS